MYCSLLCVLLILKNLVHKVGWYLMRVTFGLKLTVIHLFITDDTDLTAVIAAVGNATSRRSAKRNTSKNRILMIQTPNLMMIVVTVAWTNIESTERKPKESKTLMIQIQTLNLMTLVLRKGNASIENTKRSTREDIAATQKVIRTRTLILTTRNTSAARRPNIRSIKSTRNRMPLPDHKSSESNWCTFSYQKYHSKKYK